MLGERISGTVERITHHVANGQATTFVKLEGDRELYAVAYSSSTRKYLALTKEGDRVAFQRGEEGICENFRNDTLLG